MPRMSKKNKNRYSLLQELSTALAAHDGAKQEERRARARVSAAMKKLDLHVLPHRSRVRRAKNAKSE
jgi:hypothetical protein